jgi:hypothetical protein
MKKVFMNSIMLMAFLLIAVIVKATVIDGGANGVNGAGSGSVLGCGDSDDQQAKGVKVSCEKDGVKGTQCVTSGTGDVCDLKVINCITGSE